MWFDKHNPLVLYIDNEIREKGCLPQRKNFSVEPDLILDFRDLPFSDKTFKHIVWDPPHMKRLTEKSIMRKKFGRLETTWKEDLAKGFNELWRVLDDNGTLIFKWCEVEISTKEVLECFPIRPLYGHPTAKSGKTKWMAFFKEATQ